MIKYLEKIVPILVLVVITFGMGVLTGKNFGESRVEVVEQEYCLDPIEGYRIVDSYDPVKVRIIYEGKSQVSGDFISIGDVIENINTGKIFKVIDIVTSFSGNQVYVIDDGEKIDRWGRDLIMKHWRFADGG